VRTWRLDLCLTGDERRLSATAAEAVGETLGDFYRRAANERAQSVLTGPQRISLNEHAATRFLDALDGVNEDTVARLKCLRERSA
jgi:uncharacterized protein (DUF1778 family)